jgi:predicted RNA-binding Zn ribbon-like protein
MLFAHDTQVALQAAAALVNTLDGDDEQLPDVAALDEFVTTWGWTGERTRDQAELTTVRELRPRLRELWTTTRDETTDIVNRLLAEAHAVPQLVRHDNWDYHLHATPPHAPLATRMAVEAAMAMTDVIRADEMSRLRICEYAGCDNVVVDLSKNRSRRYCEAGCGNRAAVAAYRARKADTVVNAS